MAAIPLSTVIGAPISGLLLGLDGYMGMKGWQWLFILEAMPALVLSVVVFFYLTDRPSDATWLQPDERAWLVRRLERRARAADHAPQPERRTGAAESESPGAQRGLLRSGRHQLRPELLPAADREGLRPDERADRPGVGDSLCGRPGEHRVVGTPLRSEAGAAVPRRVPAGVASAGIALSTLFDNPVLKMPRSPSPGFGIFGNLPVFWTLPTAFLSGAAAAGGIALINSIGNLAGFAGPYAMGAIKDWTGSYTGGLLCLSALGLVAMVMVLVLGHDSRWSTRPEQGELVRRDPPPPRAASKATCSSPLDLRSSDRHARLQFLGPVIDAPAFVPRSARRYQSLQLFRPVLDDDDLRGRGLIGGLLDHEETLAVAGHVIVPAAQCPSRYVRPLDDLHRAALLFHDEPRASPRTAMSEPSGATKNSSRPFGAQSGRVPPAVETRHCPALTLGNGVT